MDLYFQALKKIPRDKYFISTKVGRFGSKFNFTADGIIEGFEQSLKRLDLEYVDLVVVSKHCFKSKIINWKKFHTTNYQVEKN